MDLNQLKEFCKNNIVSNVISDENGIKEYVFLYKNGNKIHIKKKNRGSFTKYCNGKVTNECILRGKNSPDPKIRKKAIFALNSRKWGKG